MIDPRESPFYNGPELTGLDPDAKFDLAKQLRIAARNRRISKTLIERAEQKQLNIIGAATIGCIIIVSAITAAIFGLLK